MTGSRIDDLERRYRREITASFDRPLESPPTASVILVTYRTERSAFERTLEALGAQTAPSFEIIVVDNGNDWPVARVVEQFDRVTAFARLQRNCGVTVGRNLGAALAAADLLVFLDDDAIPDRGFVEGHVRAHDGTVRGVDTDVVGVRGRVRTSTGTIYNRLQSWYDLGDEPRPYYLNTEGNSSYDRTAYRSVGGFEEDLGGVAGHEGIDLTYRLVVDGGYDRDQFVYHPDPVIEHDMATDAVSYLRKRTVQRYNRRRLSDARPGIDDFAASYPSPEPDPIDPIDLPIAYAFDGLTRVGCTLKEWRADRTG